MNSQWSKQGACFERATQVWLPVNHNISVTSAIWRLNLMCIARAADQLLPQLLMEQYDTLPLQCRHIEHMHEGVWFRKNSFWQHDNFPLTRLLYMHRWCLHGPINSYHSFWWSNLICCLYNIDTLNICMKEFGSEKINFDKMTSMRTKTIFPI